MKFAGQEMIFFVAMSNNAFSDSLYNVSGLTDNNDFCDSL